jgi:hypothetical protein
LLLQLVGPGSSGRAENPLRDARRGRGRNERRRGIRREGAARAARGLPARGSRQPRPARRCVRDRDRLRCARASRGVPRLRGEPGPELRRMDLPPGAARDRSARARSRGGLAPGAARRQRSPSRRGPRPRLRAAAAGGLQRLPRAARSLARWRTQPRRCRSSHAGALVARHASHAAARRSMELGAGKTRRRQARDRCQGRCRSRRAGPECLRSSARALGRCARGRRGPARSARRAWLRRAGRGRFGPGQTPPRTRLGRPRRRWPDLVGPRSRHLERR